MNDIVLVILFLFILAIFYDGVGLFTSTFNRLAQKFGWQDKPHTQDDLGAGINNLIGTTATVSASFSNKAEGMPFEGRVKARGSEWKAELLSEQSALSVGDRVKIVRVKGIKLYIEAVKE